MGIDLLRDPSFEVDLLRHGNTAELLTLGSHQGLFMALAARASSTSSRGLIESVVGLWGECDVALRPSGRVYPVKVMELMGFPGERLKLLAWSDIPCIFEFANFDANVAGETAARRLYRTVSSSRDSSAARPPEKIPRWASRIVHGEIPTAGR
jgi:hypothetical protein